MEWILFTIGLLLGATMGIITMSIISSGAHSNLDNEIISLRLQRKMLKDEPQRTLTRPGRRYI